IDDCQRSYGHKDALKAHQKQKHNHVWPSSRSTADPYENVRYTKTVDPGTRKYYWTCVLDGCGKTFSQKRNTESHQRIVHKIDGDPSVVCGLCGLTLVNQPYLERHKRRVDPDNTMAKPPHELCHLCHAEVPLK